MSTEPRMQPDPLERLRSALEDTPWNHDFLADYVTELSRQKGEEEIFLLMASRRVESGAADASIPGAFPALYESMSLEDRSKLRLWWHERILREAYQHHDLGARLSWRYFV